MPKVDCLFNQRKALGEICKVPDRIISVYSLEKHIWADGHSPEARQARRPEPQTIEEFRIDPVRPFLTDVLRHLAAPYNPSRRDQPIGQGYWIQAEFGSGKSHLLCFLGALALGSREAWELVRRKEEQAGRGKRENLYQFWEDGLASKCSGGKKGPLVVVRTLVGTGGGAIGLGVRGRSLSDYILEAVKDQLQVETGKNLSLYPAEILADRFLESDLARYRADLKKFLRDPRFFEEDEFEEVDDFLRVIQDNQAPEYKRSCGNKLWRFYTEYLRVQPQVPAETEDILKHVVETILAEGYAGLLLMLDEVSLFMKNRDDDQRADDEKTLVVLSNRLAKVHNLPVWTICAAQQAIESKLGVKNIIADDRLKMVPLLQNDQDYYDIVLNRVREITNPEAIASYYAYYKQRFPWAAAMGEKDFNRFFPFHQPAVEVLRAITYELTTARSAIHFMHQTLKHQVKHSGRDLIRLWELFDEAVRYEEDPSNLNAAIVAIKTKKEADFRAYESSRRQIDSLGRGYLKVNRDKAIKTIQTLFLYHIARTRQQGLSAEEIANSVLIERDADATMEENVLHYETLAENLKKELRQIALSYDEDRRPRYRFEPVFTGVDPRAEFQKARAEAEENENLRQEAWKFLLSLDQWLLNTRQMTVDLSYEVKSIFRTVVPASWPYGAGDRKGDREIEVVWKGRQVVGMVGMRDLAQMARDQLRLPPIDTDQTDRDYACYIGTGPVAEEAIGRILERTRDPRVLIWSPAEERPEERERLIDLAAYKKLVDDWSGKETEDAAAVINWVSGSLQTDLGKIYRTVTDRYTRGRIDALNHRKMEFHVAGDLENILPPLVDRVLTAAYESREIAFEPPFIFRKEEGVKVINGIVRTGEIPKGKPNQNVSAAQNFGPGLRLMKKASGRQLDTSDNRFVQELWSFIDGKLADDGQVMRIETLYKNFMGLGGPKDYGLTRRMVQVYLLCLAQQGRIRIGLGPRSGLPYGHVDYANLGEIDFSSTVLAALGDVQKMARPEHWDVLRPYAEKLLEKPIPSTFDEAAIAADRKQLRDLFAEHREIAPRLEAQARDLFAALGTPAPYETEIGQAARLFATDLSGGDDIDRVLHGLKEAYGYRAFDAQQADPREVDDLANRLRNYRDMRRFVGYDRELRTAQAYVNLALPEGSEWKPIRRLQRDELARKLADLRPFIDSDARLRTELLGHHPPEPSEKGTLGRLIHEYTTLYAALHDTVLGQADADRNRIEGLLRGEAMRACRKLEGIVALQPRFAAELEGRVGRLLQVLFTCPNPARRSIEERLRMAPVHDCGLDAENASRHTGEAKAAADEAERLVRSTLHRKLELFLNPGIRQRLEQGRKEPLIEALLGCRDVEAVEALLVPAVLKNDEAVAIINRYLKRIAVKPVRLADFRPGLGTVERDQVAVVVRAFERFLVDQFADLPDEDDALPMLRLE